MKRRLSLILILALVVMTMPMTPFGVSEAQAETQNAYRWRNDDGSETTATWAEAENTPLDVDKYVPERLRFGVENNGTESVLARAASQELATAIGQIIYPQTSVVDMAGGYAYIIGGYTPATVYKFRLSDATVVAALQLESVDGTPRISAIDTVHGFAYFATNNTNPVNIVKVDLSDFTRVGSLSLNAGEANAGLMLVDGSNNLMYVGTATSPGKIVKVNLSDFSRVGVITLDSGENILYAGVIDVGNGFAYVGTGGNPGKIIKIDLSDFTRVAGGISLSGLEYGLRTAVIDTTNHFAYFGTFVAASDGIVIKIDLTSFTRTSAITMGSGDIGLTSAVIDVAGGKAFFGTQTIPARVAQIDLASFTRDSTVTAEAGEDNFRTAFIDTSNDIAYFVADVDPGIFVKFDSSGTLSRTGSYTYPGLAGENNITTGVLDTANGYGYFATDTVPTQVLKVNLSTLAVDDKLTLNSGEDHVYTSEIDTVHGLAYFVTQTDPSIVVKVNLGSFTRVGAITLSAGESWVNDSAIDPTVGTNGVLYVGTYNGTGSVVKIDLDTFTRTDAVTLGLGENDIWSVDIDTVNGNLFVGTDTEPGIIVKVDLSPFQRVGALTLTAGGDEGYVDGLVIDDSAGFGYAGTYSGSGTVVKFNTSTMARVADIQLSAGAEDIIWASIDADKGFAYFTTVTSEPFKIVQVNLATFTEENVLTFEAGESFAYELVIDSAGGVGYIGTYTNPSIMVKLDITPTAELRLEYGVKSTSCPAISSWTQVASSSGSGAWVMSNSSNLTNGAATTNVGSGVTDGNTNLVAGETLDTSSQMSKVALGLYDFTEVEYSLKATSLAADDTTYCFRLTDAGIATDFTYSNYAEAILPAGAGGGGGVTETNRIVMTRLKVGTPSTADIYFVLTDTLDGTLTVTFPDDFTITGAPTAGTCVGGTLDTFGSGAHTFTAVKHSCSGAITLTGGTVVNPGSPGSYYITWENDDPGGAAVPITLEDQITVTAGVNPYITFQVVASSTSCSPGSSGVATDHTPSGDGGTVAFGNVTASSVVVSNLNSAYHICTFVSTNAVGGYVLTVDSAYGALQSTGTPGDYMPYAGPQSNGSVTFTAGTGSYGLCLSTTIAPNMDTTSPAGNVLIGTGNFAPGTCTAVTTDGQTGGALTTSTQQIGSSIGAVQEGSAEWLVKISTTANQIPHTDYTDTLTFIATGTF